MAVDPDASKADEARRLGASELLPLEAFSSTEGRFDLVLNTAPVDLGGGGKFELLRPLAANGTFVQIGIPGGDAQVKVRL